MQPVRWMANRRIVARRPDKRWWQPVLPALASEVAPHILGKSSNRRRKMQQKTQQIYAMQARRIEGNKRNRILREQKHAKAAERVRQVYRDYAEYLQEKARAREARAQGEVPPVEKDP